MDFTSIIGVTASIFTGISLVPQLIKLIRDKKADGLSLQMLSILFTGLALWVYYGILRDDLIIIISNAFSLMVNGAIGVLSFVYKNKT